MSETLAVRRSRFFDRINETLGQSSAHLLLVTHCLADRPEFIDAVSRLVSSVKIVAIPYSIHEPTIKALSLRYSVSTPSMVELHDVEFLRDLLECLPNDGPIVIAEIGGYFAPLIANMPEGLQHRVLGVIEDTEAGHRRYLAVRDSLRCAVVSVARSPLKEPEDSLVGASCVFSVERIVRDLGTVLDAQQCLVIGYGKVGRGLANHLRDRRLPVSVYDSDPVRRVCALSEGFLVPHRNASITGADIIFGATGNLSMNGNDVSLIRDGALLVSCSSRTQEFDLLSLRAAVKSEVGSSVFEKLSNESKTFYIASGGYPINFRDGAVIGPALSLVQAEILAGISMMANGPPAPGIHSVPTSVQQMIAEQWLAEFTHIERGSYRRSL